MALDTVIHEELSMGSAVTLTLCTYVLTCSDFFSRGLCDVSTFLRGGGEKVKTEKCSCSSFGRCKKLFFDQSS